MSLLVASALFVIGGVGQSWLALSLGSRDRVRFFKVEASRQQAGSNTFCAVVRSILVDKRKEFIQRYASVVLSWCCLFASIALLTLHLFTLHLEYQLSTPRIDPYSVLELPLGSNHTMIKRQFRKLCMPHHPDNYYLDGYDWRVLVLVSVAYEILTDGPAWDNWVQHGDPMGPSKLSLFLHGNVSLLIAAVFCVVCAFWPWLPQRFCFSQTSTRTGQPSAADTDPDDACWCFAEKLKDD